MESKDYCWGNSRRREEGKRAQSPGKKSFPLQWQPAQHHSPVLLFPVQKNHHVLLKLHFITQKRHTELLLVCNLNSHLNGPFVPHDFLVLVKFLNILAMKKMLENVSLGSSETQKAKGREEKKKKKKKAAKRISCSEKNKNKKSGHLIASSRPPAGVFSVDVIARHILLRPLWCSSPGTKGRVQGLATLGREAIMLPWEKPTDVQQWEQAGAGVAEHRRLPSSAGRDPTPCSRPHLNGTADTWMS